MTLVAGTEHFDPTVEAAPVDRRVAGVRNYFFLQRRLGWQRGARGEVLRAGVAVMELNPRMLSTWWILLLRRALRRPSVLWGHTWSRRGPGSRTEVLRRAMRSLATVVLL